jgi:hypothetical protein
MAAAVLAAVQQTRNRFRRRVAGCLSEAKLSTTTHLARSLKFRAVFDHPLEHLLALAHEFDLIPNWNKCAPAFLGERGGSRLGRQSDRGCKQRHAGCLLWYGLLRGCTLRMTLPPNPNPQVFPGGADAGGAVCV